MTSDNTNTNTATTTKDTPPLAAYLVCSSFMPEGHGSIIPYGEAAHPLLEKYKVNF